MVKTMARKSMINVRLAEQTHEDFKIVAELRGASMSTILHQFIIKAIREEKEASPQAFNNPKQQKRSKEIGIRYVEMEDGGAIGKQRRKAR